MQRSRATCNGAGVARLQQRQWCPGNSSATVVVAVDGSRIVPSPCDCGPSAPLPIEATERLWTLSVVSKGMLLFSRKTTWMEPVYSFHVLLIFVTKMLLFMLTDIQIPAKKSPSTKWNMYLSSILKLGSDLMNAKAPVSTYRLLCNWVIIFSMFILR